MVSIIVPAYNCIKSLEYCVRSIQQQTYTGFELILVDDGSIDGSGELCDKFAAADSRIKVIHKPNGGVSAARNVGIDAATSEYITFCDSDDYLEPTFIEELIKYTKKDYDIISYNCTYIEGDKKAYCNDLTQDKEFTTNKFELIKYSKHLCGTLFKSNLWDKVKYKTKNS